MPTPIAANWISHASDLLNAYALPVIPHWIFWALRSMGALPLPIYAYGCTLDFPASLSLCLRRFLPMAQALPDTGLTPMPMAIPLLLHYGAKLESMPIYLGY
jgi:hypothetical protein